MIFGDFSPIMTYQLCSQWKVKKPTNRHFMLCSTSRRSLKPIPQGLPGVASSMNRPNSGWKIGSGSACLVRFRSFQYPENHHSYLATSWRSGTQPPCLQRASSLANDSRISACRNESFTVRDFSSKATTRYSTCNMHQHRGRHTSLACPPHLPIAEHRVLCPWLAAISREVATRMMSSRIYAGSSLN